MDNRSALSCATRPWLAGPATRISRRRLGTHPGSRLRGSRRVIATDTNILVYAHRTDSEWHPQHGHASLRSPKHASRGGCHGRAFTSFWPLRASADLRPTIHYCGSGRPGRRLVGVARRVAPIRNGLALGRAQEPTSRRSGARTGGARRAYRHPLCRARRHGVLDRGPGFQPVSEPCRAESASGLEPVRPLLTRPAALRDRRGESRRVLARVRVGCDRVGRRGRPQGVAPGPTGFVVPPSRRQQGRVWSIRYPMGACGFVPRLAYVGTLEHHT